MSKVLVLSLPSHGHVNPLLGLIEELVKQEEEVIYICSENFKEKIESTGAIFKCFGKELKCLNNRDKYTQFNFVRELLRISEKIIQDTLEQIKDIKFNYIICDSMFPFGNMISQILRIPLVSSFAIFATPKELRPKLFPLMILIKIHPNYYRIATRIKKTYRIKINMPKIFFNKGDLNIAYTSKNFVSDSEYYDNSFRFIGPPIYNRKENLDFPFEKLNKKKVIYISLGTVFTNNNKLYNIFFKTFADIDAVVVMSTYNIDISKFKIPKNFIVKNYVPQTEVLKYTDVAITHAGMNSTNELLYNNIPFVAIPLGADNPYIASRVSALGAAISLDKNTLTPEILKNSVEKVLTDPKYLKNIKKINKSFKDAGGYKKAVEEIFKFKKDRGINI